MPATGLPSSAGSRRREGVRPGRGALSATLYTRNVKLVTTHLGADFDALGAAMGATLLVSGSRIVFPGSQEVAVRRFLGAERVEVPEVRVRELRRARIDEVTVVDCSSLRRLGEVGELIVRAGCPVRVIDHHPESTDPIPGAEVITAPVAATCTVVAQLFQERGVTPDPLLASLLLLGIYEDTGGLTYVDTTAADVAAAAGLLEQGARLDWVRRYVLRPLEPEQLHLLNQLVEGALERRVGGVRIVVTVARPSDQVEEAAYVIHRYAEIFDLPVVIALLEVPPQLVVIARSSHPHVDAGRLLAPHGGGGHATAAAARLRGRSAVEVSEELLAKVAEMLGSGWNAGSLATSTLHSCDSSNTVAEAKARMVRLRINAMPVAEGGALIGVVTRQVLDNALAHGLNERLVTSVMRPGVPSVAADTPVEELERLFMEGQTRFVVVPIRGGWGVITRMDLFRRMYDRQLAAGGAVDRRVTGTRPVVQNVAQKLRLVLPPTLHEVLVEVGRAADRRGMGAFLVGGAVRDVLLSRGVEDVDIVAEGNGIELAADVIAQLGGRMHPHEPFLTAVVQLPSGIRLDIATARTEFYRSPASLPEVERSAVRQDLYRRDFTINAMAIDLSPGRFGDLLDFFGGQRDLERKLVRVLHSLSFLDDPTRAIRAVRFATRLGFEIASETQQLVRVAVREGVFASLSGERIRGEMGELLAEARPTDSLVELDRLEVLREIAPGVALNAATRRFLAEVEAMLAWAQLEEVYRGPAWPVFVAALAVRAGERGGEEIAARLSLSGRRRHAIGAARVTVERILAAVSPAAVRPSEVVRVLERSDPTLWVVGMAAAGQAQRRRLRNALTLWRHQPPPVNGAQLIAAGIAPGPRVGHAVRASRDALLDGRTTVEEALQFALAVARESGDGA